MKLYSTVVVAVKMIVYNGRFLLRYKYQMMPLSLYNTCVSRPFQEKEAGEATCLSHYFNRQYISATLS